MALGIFIGSLAVLIIGFGLVSFGWYAGSTTGAVQYQNLGCGENIYNRSPEMEEQCSAATGGMIIGIGVWIIAFIFVVVGFIATLITGIKLAIDTRKQKQLV